MVYCMLMMQAMYTTGAGTAKFKNPMLGHTRRPIPLALALSILTW